MCMFARGHQAQQFCQGRMCDLTRHVGYAQRSLQEALAEQFVNTIASWKLVHVRTAAGAREGVP